jgi:hypothetical protein
MKYQPDYPQRFDSQDHACLWLRAFFPLIGLKLPISVLAVKYNFTLQEDFDDLDLYSFVALEHPVIGQFWLFQYRNSDFVDVLVDSKIELEVARKIIMEALKLNNEDISWFASDDY